MASEVSVCPASALGAVYGALSARSQELLDKSAKSKRRRAGSGADGMRFSARVALALSLVADAHPQLVPRVLVASRACLAACAAMRLPSRYENARASELMRAAERAQAATAPACPAVASSWVAARKAFKTARRLVRRACVNAISDAEAAAFLDATYPESSPAGSVDPVDPVHPVDPAAARDSDTLDEAAWDLAEDRTDAFFARLDVGDGNEDRDGDGEGEGEGKSKDEEEMECGGNAYESAAAARAAAVAAVAAASNSQAVQLAVRALCAAKATARECCRVADALQVAAVCASEAVVDFYALLRLCRLRQAALLRVPFDALVIRAADAVDVDASADTSVRDGSDGSDGSGLECSVELDACLCALRLRAPKAVALASFARRFRDTVVDGLAEDGRPAVEGVDALLRLERGAGSRALVWQLPTPPEAPNRTTANMVFVGVTVWTASAPCVLAMRERAIPALPEVEPFRAQRVASVLVA